MPPNKRRPLLERLTTFFENLSDRKHELLHRIEGYFDQFISFMVYISIAVIILESDKNLNNTYGLEFARINFFIYFIFSVEYIYKHFWSTRKFRSIFTPGSLLDILALIPFYMPMFTAWAPFNLHLLRLVWVIKIFRVPQYRRTVQILGRAFRHEKETLNMTFSLCFALILVSSVLMWTIENSAQPEKFPSIIATMWWSVATLTTVGYGDVYPITVMGKILASITAILGIAIFVIPTGVISAGFITEYQNMKEKEAQNRRK